MTVQTNLAGLSFTVDGTTYSSTQTFSWVPGSSHTIATTSPQNGATGVRYVWTSWTDGGPISHTVAPTTNKIYTANFNTQYFLTMAHGTGGTVTPASGWKNSGATVSISATPANGYSFSNWTGTGSGSYSGTNNPASITMNGPITENASFTGNATPTPTPTPTPTATPTPTIQVTVRQISQVSAFSVDGTTYSRHRRFPGCLAEATPLPQLHRRTVPQGFVTRGLTGADGGAISHTVTPTTNKIYTATFQHAIFPDDGSWNWWHSDSR